MGPDEPAEQLGLAAYDLAAEAACLGAMLLSAVAVEEVASRVTADDYYKPAHAMIHSAILASHAAGHPTDPVVVAHHLAKQKLLAKVGGAGYLHELMTSVPTAQSGGYYAHIVAMYSRQRKIDILGIRLRQAAEDGAFNLLPSLATELQTLTQDSTTAAHNPLLVSLDWKRLLATDFRTTDFITKPLLHPGAQIAVIGDGKVGKSLFCFEWACALATGQPFLGWTPGRKVRGLYIDQENGHPEIQRRLRTTGYDKQDLSNLIYVSFANIGALDTPQGAADLMALVGWANPEVVWLDTVSRLIQGEENTSDTWLQLYRLSLRPLKDLGVACVRLDHFGKDKSRGSRGSSAKTQDVDHVWEMTDQPGAGLIMRRTHTRNGIGEGILWMRRTGDPKELGTTHHELVSDDPADQERFIIRDRWNKMLSDAGIPWTAGRQTVVKFLRERGEKVRTDEASDLVAWRKEHDPLRQDVLDLDDEVWEPDREDDSDGA